MILGIREVPPPEIVPERPHLACGLILDGALELTGVRIPVHESIYQPALAGLAKRGIEVVEDEVG